MRKNPIVEKNLQKIKEWRSDVFLFCAEALNMKPSEPIDELRGKPIRYIDSLGREQTTILFDTEGRLVYHDLSFYTIDMFKNQSKALFKRYKGTRYTWQQTVSLEAYNRALKTFDQDAFDKAKRWITIRSGHGIGKTALLSTIALHFLGCFFGSQIGATANTEQQLKDIFLKELYFWSKRLPEMISGNFEILDDMVRIKGTKDWFLRARVSRADKPEALAGLHGKYVLILVDEASGVDDMVYEVMKGALTGANYIVIYTSNPTRTEGEFFNSHKPSAPYTKLKFSSRHSPIVEDGYVERMEEEYPANNNRPSDTVLIRVEGEFAGENEMDDKGWIPLFANLSLIFEPYNHQIIRHPIIGVDPAGAGRDSSLIGVRDLIYLKEVLNEQTSNEKDLARKIETIRDTYGATSNDIGIEAFGIGAKVVANVNTKTGENVNAVLTDKPREETKDKFHTFKSELAWKFREWVAKGGIIITNNKAGWIKELEKIKYKRDKQGRIMLMDKTTFKKEYGFSPDRFDMACMTFFKDEATMPVIITKTQLEAKDMQEWLNKAQQSINDQNYDDNFSSFSSM